MRIHSARQMNFVGRMLRARQHKNKTVNKGLKEKFRKTVITHFRGSSARSSFLTLLICNGSAIIAARKLLVVVALFHKAIQHPMYFLTQFVPLIEKILPPPPPKTAQFNIS